METGSRPPRVRSFYFVILWLFLRIIITIIIIIIIVIIIMCSFMYRTFV